MVACHTVDSPFSNPFLLNTQTTLAGTRVAFLVRFDSRIHFLPEKGSVCFQHLTPLQLNHSKQLLPAGRERAQFVLVCTPAKLQLALIDGIYFCEIIFNNVDNRREE